MKKSWSCVECTSIANELANALKASLREGRKREQLASQPFHVRMQKFTDNDWTQMAAEFETSNLTLLRRKAEQHRLITGHRLPIAAIPFGKLF